MMFPLVGVPQTIANGMNAYRGVFCRAEGFEHVSRYFRLVYPDRQKCSLSQSDRWPGSLSNNRWLRSMWFVSYRRLEILFV